MVSFLPSPQEAREEVNAASPAEAKGLAASALLSSPLQLSGLRPPLLELARKRRLSMTYVAESGAWRIRGLVLGRA